MLTHAGCLAQAADRGSCATVPAMAQITIRGTRADLPAFDADTELEPVRSLGAAGGSLSSFEFGGASMRAVELKDRTLWQGKIHALRAERASMTALDVHSVEFTGCELGSLRWTRGKISGPGSMRAGCSGPVLRT
jgi:hypothetical protein